jgi:hypothetical protein
MKKATIPLLMLLLIMFFATEAQALVSFGIKGGINSSKMLFSPAVDFPNQDYLQGYSFGAFLTINIGPLGLQPEVLYSRRGLEFQMPVDPSDPDTLLEAKARLDYIEIPLLVRLNIIPAGPFKAYIFGGPSYGFLQKARLDRTYEGATETQDIKDDFKSSALALVGGLGIDIKIPFLFKVTVDARYHYGLYDILSDTSSLHEMTDKARHSGFSIMAGISF